MITFVCWKWGKHLYNAGHVNYVAWAFAHHHKAAYRLICVTDDPTGITGCETFPLWDDHSNLRNPSGPQMPSCYRRLKLFDAPTQMAMGIIPGTKVCSIDLDTLFLSEVTDLYARPEPFVAVVVKGHNHVQVINGSMFMFTAGEYQWLWDRFDPVTSPGGAVKARFLGSDQGYLSWKLAGKIGGEVGGWFPRDHGVLSYWRDLRVTRVLPANTKIVFFSGNEKYWQNDVQRRSPWIKRYLLDAAQAA